MRTPMPRSLGLNELNLDISHQRMSSGAMTRDVPSCGVPPALTQASPASCDCAFHSMCEFPLEESSHKSNKLNCLPSRRGEENAALKTSLSETSNPRTEHDLKFLKKPFVCCSHVWNFFKQLCAIVSFYRSAFGTIACFSLPLLIFLGWSASDVRARCIYVIAVMILGWISNFMDAYAVSLLPFILFPILKVVSVGYVAAAYLNSVSFLIFGASMMAAALRRVKLDIATANWLARISPRHPEELALCLMSTCFVVSTCLSNTGTMLIFCPIIDLMVRDLYPELRKGSSERNSSGETFFEDSRAAADSGERSASLPHQESRIAFSDDHAPKIPRSSPDRRNGNHCGKVPDWSIAVSEVAGNVVSPDASREIDAKVDCAADRESVAAVSDEILIECPELRRIRNLLFIGCAYAATLGGSATATGSTSNAIFLSVLDAMYSTLPGGSAANPVTYTTWLIVSVPLGLIQLFLVWASLNVVWMGPKATMESLVRLSRRLTQSVWKCLCKSRSIPTSSSRNLGDRASEPSTSHRTCVTTPARQGDTRRVEDNQAETHNQDDLYTARVCVIVTWLLLVCLWLSRKTIVRAVPGWGSHWEGYIDDSWPAMVLPLFLWFVPLHPRSPKRCSTNTMPGNCRWQKGTAVAVSCEAAQGVHSPEQTSVRHQDKRGKFEGILTFAVVEKEMDWGLLFLLGSGFVIASVSHNCDLDKVMVENLEFLKSLSLSAKVACTMCIAALITQIASNTATASIIMPLLSIAVKGLPENPLLLMLAANFATSLGFLLPVSTASNAVIFRFTQIGFWKFFLSGLLPLVLCLACAYAAVFTWVAAVFNLLGEYPQHGG